MPQLGFGLHIVKPYQNKHICYSLDAQKVSELQQEMRDLYAQGKPLEGNEQTDMAVEQVKKTELNKGLAEQWVNSPIVKNFACK